MCVVAAGCCCDFLSLSPCRKIASIKRHTGCNLLCENCVYRSIDRMHCKKIHLMIVYQSLVSVPPHSAHWKLKKPTEKSAIFCIIILTVESISRFFRWYFWYSYQFFSFSSIWRCALESRNQSASLACAFITFLQKWKRNLQSLSHHHTLTWYHN